jgi:adenylate cyclase
MRYTSREAADAAGLAVDEVRRVWRALGFPDAAGQAAYTEADVEALRVVAGLLRDEHVDEDTLLRLARSLGRTMSRLAEWQVSTVVDGRRPPITGARSVDAFEQLLVHSWRRHLEAATARVAHTATAAADQVPMRQTVGFADLVGFTSLSNVLDRNALAALVEAFEGRCADVVAARGGRVVKTLGDSVLFTAGDPVVGTEIALAVVEAIGGDRELPDVRVGIATGPIVMRMGDVFGPPVNLAARLTTVARRNRVIADSVTVEALPPDGYDTRVLPARRMHGFGDVEPITVRRGGPAQPLPGVPPAAGDAGRKT